MRMNYPMAFERRRVISTDLRPTLITVADQSVDGRVQTVMSVAWPTPLTRTRQCQYQLDLDIKLLARGEDYCQL